ncbi:MAG: type II toxin-antitoxin system prevent-host-death family antitoxin [Acidobacteriota bacterium]
MRQMNASKFKEQCLWLLDHLERDGIIVTKRGKPVARLVPADSDCASLIGSMKGKIEIRGGILSTGLDWDAQS